MESENILKRLSILCVEDEKAVEGIIYRYMKRRFGIVYMAYNGKDGLEMYLQHRPDIVITDNKMPIMDGITMSNLILEINNKQPIIITKSFIDDEDIRCNTYTIIKKPVDMIKLMDALYNYLRLV
ncbi:response regulator transcription factor [Candidatus Magnetomonas plexicatena]|uniref:response regulator transcription factor n=1 Tax=Candidatus Magnetomonas plexicatena TaxID=2552947 RepID=UPI00110190D4|nr:response regulator [Nitrospirales bacterium LBB_01]